MLTWSWRCLRNPAVAAVLYMLAGSPLPGQEYVSAQLPWHAPVLDAHGKLLAWYEPDKNRGYDKVLRLGWDFIEHKVPNDARTGTGLKIYLINACLLYTSPSPRDRQKSRMPSSA